VQSVALQSKNKNNLRFILHFAHLFVSLPTVKQMLNPKNVDAYGQGMK
jgi:hypothetical protein